MATTAEPQSAPGAETETEIEPRPESALVRYFELAKYNVTVGSEIMAGVTTFLVMAYIAFVNPGILSSVADRSGFKLDFAATVTATCWISSFLCILMGAFARRPFAMAPGMGLNAVVTYQLVAAQGLSWSQAMGIIVLEGIIITALVLTKFRQIIMDIVPMELKRAIAAGIGLFILYIGLINGGLVQGNPGLAQDPTAPPVQLGNFGTLTILVAVFGVLLTAWLEARKMRAALLVGILGATIFAILLNYGSMAIGNGAIYPAATGWAVIPVWPWVQGPAMPAFFGLDLGAFASHGPISSSINTFSIMLSDFFDTMGTFVGVGLIAGFLNAKGQLPQVERPLLVELDRSYRRRCVRSQQRHHLHRIGRGRVVGRAHRHRRNHRGRDLPVRAIPHACNLDCAATGHRICPHHRRLLHDPVAPRDQLDRLSRGLPGAYHHDRHASHLQHHQRDRIRRDTFHCHDDLHRCREQSPLAHVRDQRRLHPLLPLRTLAGVDRGTLGVWRLSLRIHRRGAVSAPLR